MRLLSALHLHHPPMFRYLLRKMYFATVFLEWDISNQNYLFGSGQKGSKCNAASRDKKHIKVLSEKAYFIMAGGTAVGILWHANLIVPF